MRHEIRSEIEIEAPPEAVWEELADLAGYAEWNPFITRAEGAPEPGQRLSLRMQPSGGRAMTIRPTVTTASEGSTFEWLGHLGVPGLFDGRHRFELTPTPAGTRVVQSESFSGVLVRPLRRSLDTGTLAGFEAMNEALRQRVLAGRAAP
jgi:hypothetical protein